MPIKYTKELVPKKEEITEIPFIIEFKNVNKISQMLDFHNVNKLMINKITRVGHNLKRHHQNIQKIFTGIYNLIEFFKF